MRNLWIGVVATTLLVASGCSSRGAADEARDPITLCESLMRLEFLPGFSGLEREQLEPVANEYLEVAIAALANAPDELKLSIGAVAQSAQDLADLVEAAAGDPARLRAVEISAIEEAFRANMPPVSRWAANDCHDLDLTDPASVVQQLYEVSNQAPDGVDRDHNTEARLDLYAFDAEIHGHPLSSGTVVRGIAAIRDLIDLEYELGPLWGGKGGFGQVVVTAGSATWNETRDYEDGTECSFNGNRITIADGLITRHEYGAVTCDA